jgi:hypothetical protein
MELNLQQRRKALLAKIPDMEQTLSVVNFLAARRRKALGEEDEEEEKGDDLDDDDIDALLDGDEEEEDKDKPLTTLFELNDTLYAEAQVQETGEVGLWLGVSGGWGGADPRQTPCSCTPSRRRPSC